MFKIQCQEKVHNYSYYNKWYYLTIYTDLMTSEIVLMGSIRFSSVNESLEHTRMWKIRSESWFIEQNISISIRIMGRWMKGP